MSATALRPRRVGEILDAAIKVYLGNARTLMGLSAIVIIPVQLFAAIALLSTVSVGSDVPNGLASLSARQTTTVSDAAARLGAQATLVLAQLIAGWLITAACVKAVSDSYLDQPTGAGASLRFALRRLPTLIGMEILMFLGLILAFIALVIPGIWLYAAWAVAVPALLIEKARPLGALRRSRRLVRGRWWPTAGVLLVSTIMVAVVSGAFQALLVAVASLPAQPSVILAVSLATLSGAVGAIIAEPFRAAVITVLYYDLRVRHEGYDLQLLAEQLGLPPPSLGSEESALGGGLPAGGVPLGPESVGQPGGPPFWPPPPGWRPSS
jgi:hypothetical protein